MQTVKFHNSTSLSGTVCITPCHVMQDVFFLKAEIVTKLNLSLVPQSSGVQQGKTINGGCDKNFNTCSVLNKF